MQSGPHSKGSWEQFDDVLDVAMTQGSLFTGWAVLDDAPAAAVRLWVDDRIWSVAVVELPRPDVASFLGYESDDSYGWELEFLPSGLTLGRSYRGIIEAMAADGTFLVIGQRQLRIADVPAPNTLPAGVQIAIDLPEPDSTSKSETVLVRGWLDSASSAVDRVDVLVDGSPVGRARCFIPRPDVAAATGDPLMAFCGYEFHLPRGVRTGSVVVQVQAVLSSGSTIVSEPCRFEFAAAPEAEAAPEIGFTLARTAAEPRPESASPGGLIRVLVATHSLELGGGQLWLTDLLNQLRPEPDLDLSVLSLDPGLLLEDLREAGIEVHLTMTISDGDRDRYECRVQELCALLAAQRPTVLLCNTLGTFPIADAAIRLGIPVVWAIHEHFDLTEWWPWRNKQIQGSYSYECFVTALRQAEQLVFESVSTRVLFEQMLGQANGSTIYYGIDTEAVARYQREHDRAAIRRELQVAENEVLIVSMATFEPRKSQPAIVDVFTRVSQRHNDLALMLVGAGDTAYAIALKEMLSEMTGPGRIVTVPATRDIWRYYHAADLLISASDVESMPRSFMEAIAFGTPIVTTDVAGCKELVFDGVSGWTTPVRTTLGLEMALERALAAKESWPSYAAAGRDVLARRHSSSDHGSEIAQLLRHAAVAMD